MPIRAKFDLFEYFHFPMLKRLRFLLTSALLSVILGALVLGPYSFTAYHPLFFGLITLPLAYLALGRLRGIENITFLIPAFFMSLGFALAFFHFPNFERIYEISFLFVLFSSFYLFFLSANIFKVSRSLGRKIPLSKSAYPAFFLLMFLITFLNLTAIYKALVPLPLQLLLIFGYIFLTSLCFIWFLSLSDLFEKRHFIAALLVAFAVFEISFAFSFSFFREDYLRAMVISSFAYGFLGLARGYFEESLSLRPFFEYGILISAVLLINFLI